MNILVTGGAGYIGSATAEALLQAGHSVTVYDSLVTGHRQAVPAGAVFVEASLEDRPTLSRVLTTGAFEAVMHFAAFIEAGESMQDPGRFYFNNLANSLTLIETAALAGRQAICALVHRRRLSVERSAADRRVAPRTNQCLRSHQADGGTGPGLVSPDPRSAFLPRCAISMPAAPCPDAARRISPSRISFRSCCRWPSEQPKPASIFGTDYPTPDGTCIRDYVHIADLVSAHLLALDALRNQ